ncbi:MAG: hypothetical protein IKH90_07810 [Ruminococcus sp.]|nr:hypothetical protein [Ruminococcus sp.]MBR7008515.1 hypothetical protein [Ruminococcus sp.]MCR5167303.1 sigma-70 region 4 domain-containing protein [Oscillospiraceae bacterium]
MENKTLKVYDTISGKMVDVEVSDEVFTEYKRAVWREEKNDSRFYNNEIQFSMLVGGDDDAYENFHEFIDFDDSIVETSINKKLVEKISELKRQERELIQLLYFKNLSEQECAIVLKTSRQNIHNKHVRVLAKINKLLET